MRRTPNPSHILIRASTLLLVVAVVCVGGGVSTSAAQERVIEVTPDADPMGSWSRWTLAPIYLKTEPVTLDFVDAPLLEVGKFLEAATGQPIIVADSLRELPVSIVSECEVSPEVAWAAFERFGQFRELEVQEVPIRATRYLKILGRTVTAHGEPIGGSLQPAPEPPRVRAHVMCIDADRVEAVAAALPSERRWWRGVERVGDQLVVAGTVDDVDAMVARIEALEADPAVVMLAGQLCFGCGNPAYALHSQATVDFRDADLRDVARFVETTSGRSVIVADAIDEFPITMSASCSPDSELVWRLFESIVRREGLTAVRYANAFKLVDVSSDPFGSEPVEPVRQRAHLVCGDRAPIAAIETALLLRQGWTSPYIERVPGYDALLISGPTDAVAPLIDLTQAYMEPANL